MGVDRIACLRDSERKETFKAQTQMRRMTAMTAKLCFLLDAIMMPRKERRNERKKGRQKERRNSEVL
jgi:hypothetical protein